MHAKQDIEEYVETQRLMKHKSSELAEEVVKMRE
jgi:hypothetical protein